MNVSTILGNSLANTLVIPRGLAGAAAANASSAQGALCPARSKAIKRVCKRSSKNTSRMLLR